MALHRAHRAQLEFDDLLDGADRAIDTALSDTTFVVVDLETTGGSPRDDRITEIGAVKVRGGEVLGEFATLVNPEQAISASIVALTGISNDMVYRAPSIEEVLPAFLEFAAGTVLVAHNARFDTGFLRAAARAGGYRWPFDQALCTVRLARRVLSKDEAPTVKLSALATLFGANTTPTHRALDDARATVDVLHALLERVGNIGVNNYSDLISYLPTAPAEQRRKRTLADELPDTPGVYLFRGPANEVLYVGTAVSLRRRARQYFTGSETRPRMREMVALATRIDHVECTHALEAGVRELRLIYAHRPPYNRRSRAPYRGWWINLTDEPFARLSVASTPGREALGPLRTRGDATAIAGLIAATCRLRTCTRRIRASAMHVCGVDGRSRADVGGCRAAADHPVGAQEYEHRVLLARATLRGTDSAVLTEICTRIDELAAAEMFESAARLRDQLQTAVAALDRCQRLAALCSIAQMTAARRDSRGGWSIAVIRHGRLASAVTVERTVPPMPVIDAIVSAAETVVPDSGPLRGASPEEAALIYRWLTEPGTRIVSTTDGFALPRHSPASWAQWRTTANAAQAAAREYRTATQAHPSNASTRQRQVSSGLELAG